MKGRKRKKKTIYELTTSAISHAPPIALQLCPRCPCISKAVSLGTQGVLNISCVFQRCKTTQSGCFMQTVHVIDLGTEHRNQVSNTTRERCRMHLYIIHEPSQRMQPGCAVHKLVNRRKFRLHIVLQMTFGDRKNGDMGVGMLFHAFPARYGSRIERGCE